MGAMNLAFEGNPETLVCICHSGMLSFPPLCHVHLSSPEKMLPCLLSGGKTKEHCVAQVMFAVSIWETVHELGAKKEDWEVIWVWLLLQGNNTADY